MSATATLSRKFQISIPKAVRDVQHWEAGKEFAFIPKTGGVLLVPVRELKDMFGIARALIRTNIANAMIDTDSCAR